jgi:hypothetical protein
MNMPALFLRTSPNGNQQASSGYSAVEGQKTARDVHTSVYSERISSCILSVTSVGICRRMLGMANQLHQVSAALQNLPKTMTVHVGYHTNHLR